MMNRLKSDRMALVAAVSAALGLLAIVLYGVLAMDGERSSPLVYVLLLIGVLAQLVPTVLPERPSRNLLVTLAGWLGAVLYAVALALFVTERVQWLYALLSKMEAAPLTALFPVTIAAFAAALVAGLISLFCADKQSV